MRITKTKCISFHLGWGGHIFHNPELSIAAVGRSLEQYRVATVTVLDCLEKWDKRRRRRKGEK